MTIASVDGIPATVRPRRVELAIRRLEVPHRVRGQLTTSSTGASRPCPHDDLRGSLTSAIGKRTRRASTTASAGTDTAGITGSDVNLMPAASPAISMHVRPHERSTHPARQASCRSSIACRSREGLQRRREARLPSESEPVRTRTGTTGRPRDRAASISIRTKLVRIIEPTSAIVRERASTNPGPGPQSDVAVARSRFCDLHREVRPGRISSRTSKNTRSAPKRASRASGEPARLTAGCQRAGRSTKTLKPDSDRLSCMAIGS